MKKWRMLQILKFIGYRSYRMFATKKKYSTDEIESH